MNGVAHQEAKDTCEVTRGLPEQHGCWLLREEEDAAGM